MSPKAVKAMTVHVDTSACLVSKQVVFVTVSLRFMYANDLCSDWLTLIYETVHSRPANVGNLLNTKQQWIVEKKKWTWYVKRL